MDRISPAVLTSSVADKHIHQVVKPMVADMNAGMQAQSIRVQQYNQQRMQEHAAKQQMDREAELATRESEQKQQELDIMREAAKT